MDVKALRTLTYGLYIIGVRNGTGLDSGFGGCVVDSVAQISSGDKPIVVVSVNRENLTRDLIAENGELTLSVLADNVAPLTVAVFGFHSARDRLKWELVPHWLSNGLPVLTDSVAFLRLRVTETLELSTHTAFLCELTDAEKLDPAAKPLVYADYQATMAKAAKDADAAL
jgi:flavin reductase (DIM6/NTAB) family NADH-FMN oxidoreductase RutF